MSVHLIYNRYLLLSCSVIHSNAHILFRTRLRTCVLFSALGCMVRPTNAAIWVILFANLLWAVRHHRKLALRILQDIASIAFVFLSLFYKCMFFNTLLYIAPSPSCFYLFSTRHTTASPHSHPSISCEPIFHRCLSFTAQTLGITISRRGYLCFAQLLFLLPCTACGRRPGRLQGTTFPYVPCSRQFFGR